MLLKDNLPQYKEEIEALYQNYFDKSFNRETIFGIVEDDVLQAVASLKCYHGYWYLMGCVVKPEFRGRGLQRELIRERLDYLSDKTNLVRVGVDPTNKHSLNNILAENFMFERNKKTPNGDTIQVYMLELN